jgi:hypothetical protein
MATRLDTKGGEYMESDPASLEYQQLVDLLILGASGLYPIEASIRLLDRHGYWLRHEGLLRNVKLFGPPFSSAGIEWNDVLDLLDRGALDGDLEALNVLRSAASIATFYRVSLREALESVRPENIRHVVEAVMYAHGFLSSTANPLP